ncbi:MAG: 16S rRNA (uracil(1498)-N(3))-methyltransferase [Lachnospiraceae bacterium]|nr:16S rRNA (uracil(1498)-N(3))-methyltransferase [Lachnospiraceae bacterium]
MYRFYVEAEKITKPVISITGADVNHIKNVLRMRIGEELTVCDGAGMEYHCRILELASDVVQAEVLEDRPSDTELPVRLVLFQGLPKKDKMELIVQKAVELGAAEIVPVMMHRTVVKLEDPKKEAKKLERWQAIAEAAAKQSMRGVIPRVLPVMSYAQAIERAKQMDAAVLPYEHAEGIEGSRRLVQSLKGKQEIGIFIGPEGGFEDAEVEKAREAGIWPMTLGKRILRTETAGLAILSILMFELEQGAEGKEQA